MQNLINSQRIHAQAEAANVEPTYMPTSLDSQAQLQIGLTSGRSTHTGAVSPHLRLRTSPPPIYNALAITPQLHTLGANPLTSRSTTFPLEIRPQKIKRKREGSLRKEKTETPKQRRKVIMTELEIRKRDEANVATGRTVLGPSLREVENSFLHKRVSYAFFLLWIVSCGGVKLGGMSGEYLLIVCRFRVELVEPNDGTAAKTEELKLKLGLEHS